VEDVDPQTLNELRREADELSASRARIVEAAHDERRLLERELHDGAMQQLVALGVELQLARRLAAGGSPELTALLDEMRRTVHDALDAVRLLALRIYPALPLDGGLGDALRAAAAAAGIPLRVDTSALGPCPPRTQASVYFCCLDLLRGAADTGQHAAVEVRSEQERVLFEVTLGGVELEQWATRDVTGVGDRVAALGGRYTVAPAPHPEHGVRLAGSLPVQPEPQVPAASLPSASAR